MSVAELAALDVGARLAAKDCVLLMWATFPKMAEALEVIKAWGFDYKTVWATWIKTGKKSGKPIMGIGWYTRSNAEVCLLAARGKSANILLADRPVISSVVLEPRRQHSRKPDQVRRMIDVFFDGPKIELFAREQPLNWDVWGDQTDKYDQVHDPR